MDGVLVAVRLKDVRYHAMTISVFCPFFSNFRLQQNTTQSSRQYGNATAQCKIWDGPKAFFFFFPPMSLISYCQECRCVSSLYSKVSHRQTEKENTEVISSIRCVYTSMLDLWSYKYSLISRVVHICIQLSQFALIFNIYSSLQSLGNLINYTHPPSIIS